ncbi:MAG: hypothetical protein WCC64_12725 [Aliidongia sp.]
MLAIIEVASSGLGVDSYPIAVAWRLLRTGPEHHLLIRPIAGWRGWQRDAELVHRLTRQTLLESGRPVDEVVSALHRDLGQATVFSDTVGLDQVWLDRLFAAVPGSRSLSLRRYSELFAGVAPRDLEQAIDNAAIEPSPHVLVTDLRRRVLVAERYLTEMSRASARR